MTRIMDDLITIQVTRGRVPECDACPNGLGPGRISNHSHDAPCSDCLELGALERESLRRERYGR